MSHGIGAAFMSGGVGGMGCVMALRLALAGTAVGSIHFHQALRNEVAALARCSRPCALAGRWPAQR